MLEALSQLHHAGIPCALTLAPRDVRRAAAIRRQVATRALTEVTVLDRMGTLPSAYAPADVALCGGTFAAFGGHTIIEAAAAGCAIVVGPHTTHIRAHVAQLQTAGGLLQTPPSGAPATALTEVLTRLHRDRAHLRLLGDRAAAWHAERRGAAEHAAGRILSAVVT